MQTITKTAPSGARTTDDQSTCNPGCAAMCTTLCVSICLSGSCTASCTSTGKDFCTISKDNSCVSRLPPNNDVLIKGLGTRSKSIGIIRITI